MTYPQIDEGRRLELLAPPQGCPRVILDTDTYNEIDDQFAVVHAILSPDRIGLQAICAAPFHNPRSSGPADGMEKSYEEILRLLERLDRPADGFAFRGSTGYLTDAATPQRSRAAELIVESAREGAAGPLYVLAIGAITNVASAILLDPSIITNMVVVWLGGHALHWPDTREFNLRQDLHASRLIFDSGVPLVQIPCRPVASHLKTTVPEIDAHVAAQGPIGAYLAEIFRHHTDEPFGWSKVIWDISTVAWMLNDSWVPSVLEHSPILTDQFTWSRDPSRHMIRIAVDVDRDAIFRDLFRKLAARSANSPHLPVEGRPR